MITSTLSRCGVQRLVQRNVNYRTNLSKRARRERIREKGGPCASEIIAGFTKLGAGTFRSLLFLLLLLF